MKLSVVIFICAFVAACGDASGPVGTLPADTAHGEGLLLPWSQLSGRITYATNDKVVVVDALKRTVTTVYRPLADETVADIATSPDEKKIGISSLLVTGTTRVSIIDAATGNLISAFPNRTCPRWLADGRLSTLVGSGVYIDDTRVGGVQRLPLSCQTWSADGTWFGIATLVGDTAADAIFRADVGGAVSQLVPPPATSGAYWYDPALAPNGQSFALVQAGTSENTDIFLANANGTNVRQLATVFRLFGLSWSPDGKFLLGTSTASSVGSYDKAGLFIVDARDGTVRKLVNHPVYAAWWGA